MEIVTGHVTGVNGNMANVSFEGSIRKNEVGYILVEGKRLKGEVIRVNRGTASMQIYEMTNGIKVGDPVEFTGELMSVELGPGLLTQVFDGLQNPLPLSVKGTIMRWVNIPSGTLPMVSPACTLSPGSTAGVNSHSRSGMGSR